MFPTIYYRHMSEFNAQRAAKALKNKIGDSECVYLCIGTDRATGDSLGPLVGTFLKHYGIPNVYGTLDEPVHALTLAKTMKTISEKHLNSKVIAIDAALSEEEEIGQIRISEDKLKPGRGVGKNLSEVGDVTITGNVNSCGFMEVQTVQTTRLSIVMELAKKITETILLLNIQPCTEVAVTKLIESEDKQ